MHMSQKERQKELREKTRRLLDGPLKHARVVGLAAALLPVAAVPAAAATEAHCPSGGYFCGFVWNDLNGNGVQDEGEPGISGSSVTLVGSGLDPVMTDEDGYYEFFAPPDGTYELQVQIPNGSVPSPTDVPPDDIIDSDGTLSGPNSVVTVTIAGVNTGTSVQNTDFGFVVVNEVGTGAPGYWMNHPEAWPASITVGGVTYTRDQAIALLAEPGNKDKTLTMFASLVAAKLNTEWNHTNAACVEDAIAEADAWLMTYPVGIGVRASSYAWKVGEP
ncbi:MAG: hypothetical protein EHM55_02330, partial [Acidobacteria bacterium]